MPYPSVLTFSQTLLLFKVHEKGFNMVLHGNCYVNMSQHSVAAFNAKTNKYKHTLCELFNFGIDMPHEST